MGSCGHETSRYATPTYATTHTDTHRVVRIRNDSHIHGKIGNVPGDASDQNSRVVARMSHGAFQRGTATCGAVGPGYCCPHGAHQCAHEGAYPATTTSAY